MPLQVPEASRTRQKDFNGIRRTKEGMLYLTHVVRETSSDGFEVSKFHEDGKSDLLPKDGETNYTQERLELFKTASQELMTALLPIADDMDRALSELKKSENDENLQGFELINSKFNDILKTKGLTQIDVKIGDKFDSENHEAITQIKADKEENNGTVIDIVEKGYKLGEKVIRYPKVVVAI